MGGVYRERTREIAARESNCGFVFSVYGRAHIPRTNFHKHWTSVLELENFYGERKQHIVPYSLRHFYITTAVTQGLSFEEIAMHCGTSIKQIENTYLHVNEQIMANTAMCRFETKQTKYEIENA